MENLKVFIDTNVLINHIEGKVDLSGLRSKFRLYSNAIVFSEAFMVILRR